MKDLDGKRITVGSLLSQDFFFRIPPYQRPFSWERDNFDDLIDDLVTAPKDQEYFLGTIVLHKVDNKGNYEVVDGQQRLTSLMILLACLRDQVKEEKFKEGVQDKIMQKENVVDGIPEKIRLEVKDRTIFSDLVVSKEGTLKDRSKDDLREPEWRYTLAAKVFREKLIRFGEKDIQTLITFINQKCVLIYLATTSFDDAFRLFTIVNDRGKQLRRIDVLKSLNIAPDIITKKTTRDRIAQEWETLEKEMGEDVFESIFHLVRLILLKDKPQGDLLKEFEKRIFAKGTVQKGEPFVDLIFKYAAIYRSIFIDRDIIPEANKEYFKFRGLLHIMDSEFQASEWRASALFFVMKFGSEKFYEFLLSIEKLYINQWFAGVRKDERYSDYSKLLGVIEASKQPKDVSKSITFDAAAIKGYVGTQNLYGMGYCKYVLLRLELLASEHDVLKEYSAKSIEHVLPQNPDGKGYWTTHHDLKDTQGYVNCVGNLVLLSKGKNSAASNNDFDVKKEKYLKGRVSDYPRSIQVLSYTNWLKKDILERRKDAMDTFLNNP